MILGAYPTVSERGFSNRPNDPDYAVTLVEIELELVAGAQQIQPAAVPVLRDVAPRLPAGPRRVPDAADRRSEPRGGAEFGWLVDPVPRLRQGQQRGSGHRQLALAAG